MSSKSIIVTGANNGIGKSIAIELSRQKYHVVAVSRNAEKGRLALEEIKNISKNPAVDLITGDLSTIQSVKDLAKNILKFVPTFQFLSITQGSGRRNWKSIQMAWKWLLW
jgi:retinol dehydrogenase 14